MQASTVRTSFYVRRGLAFGLLSALALAGCDMKKRETVSGDPKRDRPGRQHPDPTDPGAPELVLPNFSAASLSAPTVNSVGGALTIEALESQPFLLDIEPRASTAGDLELRGGKASIAKELNQP